MTPIPKNYLNGYIAYHAFTANKSGVIMLVNHIGYGTSLGMAATFKYTFHVHTNPEDAVLEGEQWWLLEINWPRVSANRCMMESRVWSPQGRHVASAYRDVMIAPSKTCLRTS
ncbi:hypothetical protein E4U21_006715 [Claviceps maximensis]|nr:hypothetical protein E4U21_006715 [Claviceps maximensis]